MRTANLVWAFCLAFSVSTAALAFEKQSLGGGSVKPAQPSAKSADPLAAPLSNGQLAQPGSEQSGTPISIPGLGTVGVIPKMDFGMELLYGSDNGQKLEAAPENDGDGLQIRGTLKHRF